MTQTVHEQVDVAQQSLQAIPVDQINRNLDQPRKLFDVNELEELADSIQSEDRLPDSESQCSPEPARRSAVGDTARLKRQVRAVSELSESWGNSRIG